MAASTVRVQVDLAEVRKLSQQQRSVASGLKDGVSAGSSLASGDVPQVCMHVNM
jgi:hypothetical protein